MCWKWQFQHKHFLNEDSNLQWEVHFKAYILFMLKIMSK